ncbi:hypothetical protein CGH39_24695, partial [Vibrio parahaemolyticus]
LVCLVAYQSEKTVWKKHTGNVNSYRINHFITNVKMACLKNTPFFIYARQIKKAPNGSLF